MLCINCGTQNSEKARYCRTCGAILVASDTTVDLLANSIVVPVAPKSVLVGRYEVLDYLGRGGMGAVFLAKDLKLTGRQVAVKEMSYRGIVDRAEIQASIGAFEREAGLLASLDHPNLPKVSDFFSEGDNQYLVMEYVQGQTLEKKLEMARGPLPEPIVRRYAEQLCDVLVYLHGRHPPIIFRDLKPSNIMVLPGDRQIKLIDFGIARHFKPGKSNDTQAMGTPGYAAPEQYGRGQSDARTDIYALGATLHHAITGRDPSTEPFKFPPVRSLNTTVSNALEQIIGRAVMLDPGDRWQSAREMQRAFVDQVPDDANEVGVARSPQSCVPNLGSVSFQPETSSWVPPSKPAFTISRKTLKFGQLNNGKRRWRYFHILFNESCKVELHCTDAWVSIHPSILQGRTGQYPTVRVCADTRYLPKAAFQHFETDLAVTNGSSKETLNIRLTLMNLPLQDQLVRFVAQLMVMVAVALSMTIFLIVNCAIVKTTPCIYIVILCFLFSVLLIAVASSILRIQDVANLMVRVFKVSVLMQLPLFVTLALATNVLTNLGHTIDGTMLCTMATTASLLIWLFVYIESIRHMHHWQF